MDMKSRESIVFELNRLRRVMAVNELSHVHICICYLYWVIRVAIMQQDDKATHLGFPSDGSIKAADLAEDLGHFSVDFVLVEVVLLSALLFDTSAPKD